MTLSKAEILCEIKNKNAPVIISGAGIVGEVLLSVCQEAGIAVACFCDTSIKLADTFFCGLKVIQTQEVGDHYKNPVFLISVASIRDVVALLKESGFTDWYAGGILLKDSDTSQQNSDASLDYHNFALNNCILCHDAYLHPEKIFLRSIDLIITEKCSLRCRDCSNLMQYYQNPKNCSPQMLLKSIEKFCALIDEVMEFRIIGGETFMNKDWYIPVERLIDEPKVKRVVLYTNATIVPERRHVPLLQHSKVMVVATDYGELSRKLPQLREFLMDNHITHYILRMSEWLDCSSICRHNRTEEETRQIFKLCCAKNMATLSDGKVFRCPYAANAFRLKAVPDTPDDYVDIFNDLPLSETRKLLQSYLIHKESLACCDFCNGRPLSGVEVPPAIQADKPLPYQIYPRSPEQDQA